MSTTTAADWTAIARQVVEDFRRCAYGSAGDFLIVATDGTISGEVWTREALSMAVPGDGYAARIEAVREDDEDEYVEWLADELAAHFGGSK